MWSVRAISGPNKGRLFYHCHAIVIDQPKFIVQPAGRAKVLQTKRKNVHAFVRGHLFNNQRIFNDFTKRVDEATEVTYNPYIREKFFTVEDEQPVTQGNISVLLNGKVYVWGAR